ncbi:WXG100 family type VII secretion target [Amycolatopsis sp. NPDC049868]|uniref:WXG100 family type VII secretion target n=1 Tax=Amycolatopsis sp. NPDC049868 TaxID=3363934 RepID=UPI0037B09EEF
MFPFDQLGKAAKALLNEDKEVGTAIVDTVRDGVEWARVVLSGDVGSQPQAAPIPEVVQQMINGNSESWDESAAKARSLSDQHAEISMNLATMLNNLEPAWTGSAAEAARGRTRYFTEVMDSARDALAGNSRNVSNSSGSFVHAKNSFVPMVSPPPDKGFFDVISPWDTDTEDAINAYNKAGKRNVEVYDNYAQQLDSHGTGLRADYGEIAPSYEKSSVSDPSPVRGFGERSDSGAGSPAWSGGHSVTPMVGGSPPPGSIADPGYIGTGQVSGPGSVKVPAASGGHVSDGTMAVGYTPLDPRTGLPLPNVPSPNVPGLGGGSGPTTGGVNLFGGPGAVGGLGGVGKPGDAGGVPGGGRQTGTRGLVEEPGRGGAGAGRGAGNRLMGSPAGMAPGMGREAKGEDKERVRKFVQDESLFPETDKKDVDPNTGLPPVPPTIGT